MTNPVRNMLHEIYTLDRFALTIEGKPRGTQVDIKVRTGYDIARRAIEPPQVKTSFIDLGQYAQKKVEEYLK